MGIKIKIARLLGRKHGETKEIDLLRPELRGIYTCLQEINKLELKYGDDMYHSDLYPDIKFKVVSSDRRSDNEYIDEFAINWQNHPRITLTDPEQEIFIKLVNRSLKSKQELEDKKTLIDFSEEVNNIRIKDRLDKI